MLQLMRQIAMKRTGIETHLTGIETHLTGIETHLWHLNTPGKLVSTQTRAPRFFCNDRPVK